MTRRVTERRCRRRAARGSGMGRHRRRLPAQVPPDGDRGGARWPARLLLAEDDLEVRSDDRRLAPKRRLRGRGGSWHSRGPRQMEAIEENRSDVELGGGQGVVRRPRGWPDQCPARARAASAFPRGRRIAEQKWRRTERNDDSRRSSRRSHALSAESTATREGVLPLPFAATRARATFNRTALFEDRPISDE